MTVHGAPDNERIERVLVGCVKELLVNVARHSGQSRVHVRADFSAKKWNVTVTDPGTGFDRSAISPDHGLVVNVQNPWESVGGHLDLPRSIQGTTVTLTWEAPAVPTWQPKSFKPLLLIVIVSLSCHSVLGWIFSDFVYSTWLLAAGILAIWLLTASAVICHSRACFVAVALGTITWSSVMGANLAFPIELDWRIWFGGALSGLCGVLAFRSRFRLALLSVLGSYAVVAFTLVAESATVWTTVQMAGAYVGPLLATIPARVGPLVDQARDQVVHEVRLADQELENTITVSAREAQWGAHSDVIQTHVVPMLRRIANDQVLSSADRRLCRKLELTCRDIIRAASITDNELTEHAVKARLAGAEFSPAITAKASIVIAESLRRLAVGLLPKLGRGDLLTLDCDGRTGSIFLRMNHAPLPPVAHEATAQLRQLGLSVTPDIRETWAIIEVTHFDHQP